MALSLKINTNINTQKYSEHNMSHKLQINQQPTCITSFILKAKAVSCAISCQVGLFFILKISRIKTNTEQADAALEGQVVHETIFDKLTVKMTNLKH